MFDARQRLLRMAAEKLGENYNAPQTDGVIEILQSVLQDFSLEYMPKNEGEDTMIDTYLSAIGIEGKSKATVKQYTYILNCLFKTVNLRSDQISVYDLRRYLIKKKEEGLADSSLENIRQILCSYFGWLFREGLIKNNPTANLAPIKKAKVIKHAYSDFEMECIKSACKNKRDLALIMFLASTGCRVSEVCSANIEDVNFSKMECVVRGKGNKERTVYMDQVSAIVVENYLKSRTDDIPALFISQLRRRMTPNGVRAVLKKIGEITGIEKVHPHRFRRTLATNLIRHGMKIEDVASILGHDRLDTTMSYITLVKDNVKNAYQRYA